MTPYLIADLIVVKACRSRRLSFESSEEILMSLIYPNLLEVRFHSRVMHNM